MNLHGLNGASLNGSVSRVIAGAALFLTVGSAQADATRIQSAETKFQGSAVCTALAVRRLNGAADLAGGSAAWAEWMLLVTARADFTVNSGLRAAHTDAYMASQLLVLADGAISRPAIASAAGSFTLSATADVTRGAVADLLGQSFLQADASVRRAAQDTIEIDGYALLPAGSSLYADATKTSLAVAEALATSIFTADAVKAHGARAELAGKLTFRASGSSELAIAVTTSSLEAIATHTRAASALLGGAAELLGDATCTTQGELAPMSGRLHLSADARLAFRTAADFSAFASIVARPRLAERANASFSSGLALDALPVALRTAQAACTGSSDMIADGVILREGAAEIAAASGFTAEAITNPSTPAPSERTMHVQRDERALIVPSENRTMKVL